MMANIVTAGKTPDPADVEVVLQDGQPEVEPAPADPRCTFLLNGIFKYVPEDSEKARNPTFRLIREFQMVLRLEKKIYKIRMQEAEREQDEPKWKLNQYRLQQADIALNALDNLYAGRDVVSAFNSVDPD